MGFINRLFNQPDPVIEVLRSLLEAEQFKNEKLLNQILELTKPAIPVVPVKEELRELKPIGSNRFVPWSVKRQLLEEEDRAKAKVLREKAEADAKLGSSKTTEELEKELGVEDAIR